MLRNKIVMLIVALITASAVSALAFYGALAVPGGSAAPTIVIDPGHGGADGGVSGKNSGIAEAEINLEISLLLEKNLTDRGYNVVKTRTADGTVAKAGSEKLLDMEKRKETILKAAPDLVVSVHCNKFPSSSRRGAQVFYNKFSNEGQRLATTIQNKLNLLNLDKVGRAFSSLSGDYYILNCSEYPSAIVECGFLSNAEDEALLLNADYRLQLVESIADGITEFLYKS